MPTLGVTLPECQPPS